MTSNQRLKRGGTMGESGDVPPERPCGLPSFSPGTPPEESGSTLPALAGDDVPNVIGAWRSDAKATNAHLDKHAKLNDYQKKVFVKFFGRAVVTFRVNGTGTIVMEATTIPKKDGGQLELEATKSDFTFKVLDAAESQIVIKSDMGEDLVDGYPFAILKFHDQDTYSVSLSDGIAEINGREFFKRGKTTNSERDGAGQPATRPESKSEGSGRPQPESEGRSR